MVNEYMLELVEEMVKPSEMALDNQVEDQIEDEYSTVCGENEKDDDLIDFIDNGGLGYENPVNLYAGVEDAVNDEDFDY